MMYIGTKQVITSFLLPIFIAIIFSCTWLGPEYHLNTSRGRLLVSSLTNFTTITNPQQILQQFLLQYNKNGWIVSKSVEHDIHIILSVSDADVIYFDWFKREIEMFNFTLHNPNRTNTTLLTMEYFHVTWDSYLWPSFQIQVQNLDILLEFTNIFLTETNWYVNSIGMNLYDSKISSLFSTLFNRMP